MTRNELIKQVENIVFEALLHGSHPRNVAEAAVSTILAALQEPTEEMRLEAAWEMDNPRSIGSEERMNAIIVAAINASPLGEQSE